MSPLDSLFRGLTFVAENGYETYNFGPAVPNDVHDDCIGLFNFIS